METFEDDRFIADTDYDRLIDRLMTCARDENDIKLALAEIGGIFPERIKAGE